MLKKIIGGLNKRKVKVFLLFLTCSILAWSISKLSGTYESRATFELDYTNFPDTLLLNTLEKDYAVAKVRASGFQFLGYGINQKKIKVDLQKINNLNDDYFLTETELKTQFERQLSNTVSLLELEKDSFFVNLYKVILKEVPIKPNITIEVAPNHILDGNIALNPKTATIKGPAKVISKINEVFTSPLVLSELSANFTEELTLLKPDAQNVILLQEGLTGGIGSGKSTIAQIFRELGVPVYDSDKEAKLLMNTSKSLKKEIEKLLGKKAYRGNAINREYISNKVFKDDELLSRLNKIVHPEVKKHFKAWCVKQNSKYVVQESALIFENKSEGNYDKVILVTAPVSIRIARVVNRDSVPESSVLQRISSQLSDDAPKC